MICDAGIETIHTKDVCGSAPFDAFCVCTTRVDPSALTVTIPSSWVLDAAFPGYKGHHPELAPVETAAHPLWGGAALAVVLPPKAVAMATTAVRTMTAV